MEPIQFIRKATVKHMLTERKKGELLQGLKEELIGCQRELEQLEFQLHKSLKDSGNKHDQTSIRKRYKKEMDKRKERLYALNFKEQQLHKLELGSEIRAGTVDTLMEYEIGDNWCEDETALEVIIKDGKIVEFRESRSEDE
ncbi:YlqD family protein [Alkalihalobacillus sp. 1P02AB]|uniref:YlqD family protein n=1 Tax=Alkalihalobacillus sp. 1P02AB TaxID=3132260 RepID=UPI0039A65916